MILVASLALLGLAGLAFILAAWKSGVVD